MSIRASLLAAAALAAVVSLAGCESREEKAERHYQSALELLERGDEERALVELRNVFQYNGFHKEARLVYADLELRRGDVEEAYRHYLRLIEQYPDTPEVRLTLAEIAIDQGNWEEAERHGQEALRLMPDDFAAQAVGLALRYRDAVLAGDDSQREETARQARLLLASHQDLKVARRVVIDWLMSGPRPEEALAEVDRALQAEPDSLELHLAKARILSETGDSEGTTAQLREMYERFSDNQDVRSALASWLLAQGDLDGAEAFLRELAGDIQGPTDGHAAVVQFLQTMRGVDAARAELDHLIAANQGSPNAGLYRAMQAGLDFEQGRQAEALAAMEQVLVEAEPSDQTRRIKVALARMLTSLDRGDEAQAYVEEVLAEDPTHVDALKLRAAGAIADDRPGEAIVDLRTALSQSPDDVEVLTLMAEAHMRDGSLNLAGERLAVAVQVSGSAPEPSLRYAGFLIQQDQTEAAETVLSDAWSANPSDIRIALQLGGLWLDQGLLSPVREMVRQLEDIGTDEAMNGAQRLEAGLLFAQERTDEALAMLQSLAHEDGNVQDIASVLEAMLRDGRQAEGRSFLDAALSRDPDNVDLRLLDAGLRSAMGETEAAEAILRELVDENPTAEAPVRQLYMLLSQAGRAEEAMAAIDAGIADQPDSAGLLWIKAGALERTGDLAGAIAIYEELYARNSADIVVANNLASLLSQQGADPEDLDRAFTIARRLRGSDQPAFQDTLGWILAQRGENAEALTYLEPAAAGLPEDPVVQFHLGMTYRAQGRTEDARRFLTRAVELAGDRPLPQVQAARAALDELDATGPESDAAGNSGSSSLHEPDPAGIPSPAAPTD